MTPLIAGLIGGPAVCAAAALGGPGTLLAAAVIGLNIGIACAIAAPNQMLRAALTGSAISAAALMLTGALALLLYGGLSTFAAFGDAYLLLAGICAIASLLLITSALVGTLCVRISQKTIQALTEPEDR